MKYGKTDHIKIIEEIAKGMKAAGMNGAYLELGIAKACCFNRVAPYFKSSVAVDVSFDALCNVNVKSLCSLVTATTDQFFKKNHSTPHIDTSCFDLIFIDADHNYESVEKDFCNSLRVLKEDGIIILHDTWAYDKESATSCKNAWKIQDYIKYNEFLLSNEGMQYINLPFYYGLTLVKRDTAKDWWIQ